MAKIRILIVDDHAILRAGLRMLINAQPDMEVIGEAVDGNEGIRKAGETKPDVIILDITMPGISGIRSIEQIHRAYAQARVLVLTMHENPVYLRSVLEAGGSGYIVKKSADTELIYAIRVVHKGHTFIDPLLGSDLVQDLIVKKPGGKQATTAKLKKLSKREQVVLKLLAQGYTNRETADRLFISIKTIETYRARLVQKLGLRNRADLIRYALQAGILDADKLAQEDDD